MFTCGLQVHFAQQGLIARVGAQWIKNRITEINRSKRLLFENLNHTGVAAFSVFTVDDAIKALAILG